jgi:hypothetical protein
MLIQLLHSVLDHFATPVSNFVVVAILRLCLDTFPLKAPGRYKHKTSQSQAQVPDRSNRIVVYSQHDRKLV